MPPRSAGDEGGELTGRLRADGEDGGMHLHAAGNAEHRHGVADRIQNVARRPVAAGEENERHPARPQLLRGGARIRGRRGGRPSRERRDREARLRRDIAAHRARRSDQLDLRRGGGQPAQRAQRPLGRHRSRAQRLRAVENIAAIRALETDAPAHAGDGIHDQADLDDRRRHGAGAKTGGAAGDFELRFAA